MGLEISKKNEGGRVTLTLSGRIDTTTSSALQSAVDACLDGTDVNAVDIDFAGVEHIASSGLRVLAATAERLEEAKAGFRILNVNSIVREIFDMTGFSDILTIV